MGTYIKLKNAWMYSNSLWKTASFRTRFLQSLDIYSHRKWDKINPWEKKQSWFDVLLCNAWEYHITGGDQGFYVPLLNRKWK